MCGVFSPSWGVRSIFLRNYFWEEKRERQGFQKAVASRDLLHFKLELTPKYWKSHLNGDGWWPIRSWSISSSNLSHIHPTNLFRENRCWNHETQYSFLNMIGAKLRDNRNSRHTGRFKSTNQRGGLTRTHVLNYDNLLLKTCRSANTGSELR